MKQWLFHPLRSWRSWKMQIKEWLTPSEAEIRMIHDRLHAIEVAEWYRPDLPSQDSLLHGPSPGHEHSWRCVHCKDQIAKEMVLVCTECVETIRSSDLGYEVPLPHYHHQEVCP